MNKGVKNSIKAGVLTLFICISNAYADKPYTPKVSPLTVSQELLELDKDPKAAIQKAQSKQAPASPATTQLNTYLVLAAASASLGNQDDYHQNIAKAQVLAEQIPDAFGICATLGIKAVYEADYGSANNVYELAQQASKCNVNVEDPLSKAFVKELAGVAIAQGNLSKISTAAPLLNDALDVYTKNNMLFKQAQIRASLSRVYLGLRNVKSAYEELVKSYAVVQEQKDAPLFESILAYQAGLAALYLKDTSAAKRYAFLSREKSLSLQDEAGIVLDDFLIAKIAVAEHNWVLAKTLLSKSILDLKRLGFKKDIVIAQAALYRTLVALKEPAPESLIASEGLAILEPSERLIAIHQHIVDAALSQNDDKKAFTHLQEILKITNSLYESSATNILADIAAHYELDSKQSEIEKIKMAADIQKAQDQTKSLRLQMTVLSLMAAIVILVFFVWIQIKSKKAAQALALTDQGTGAPNRRSILETLTRLLDHKTPVVIGLIDLDFFKKINDTYGHAVGDEVLKAFYAACKKTLRPKQYVGRVGGEEWLVVIESDSAANMLHVFSELRKNLGVAHVPGMTDGRITFSMGVCSSKESTNITELMKKADLALYEAKANGKDQCIITKAATSLTTTNH